MFQAKFKISSLESFENNSTKINMQADTNDKDSSFTKYTPMGTLTMMCTNPEVTKQLAPGKVVTITFDVE